MGNRGAQDEHDILLPMLGKTDAGGKRAGKWEENMLHSQRWNYHELKKAHILGLLI